MQLRRHLHEPRPVERRHALAEASFARPRTAARCPAARTPRPRLPSIRNFQAASSDVSRSWKLTRNTDASVVNSTAIHRMPRLLDTDDQEHREHVGRDQAVELAAHPRRDERRAPRCAAGTRRRRRRTAGRRSRTARAPAPTARRRAARRRTPPGICAAEELPGRGQAQPTKVSARPPTMHGLRDRRGPPRPPTAAVSSGTARVQTSRFTVILQLREPADVHRLEPIDDALDEDAEDEHGQDDVERDARVPR